MLDPLSFIKRYINEIQNFGYKGAPLEKMAYDFESHYREKGENFDVPSYVLQKV